MAKSRCLPNLRLRGQHPEDLPPTTDNHQPTTNDHQRTNESLHHHQNSNQRHRLPEIGRSGNGLVPAPENDRQGSARPREERRLEIIELAREQREQEGAVEIDDNALLSEGNDNGCYVQAWVWVDFAGTIFDKEAHETD